MPNIAKSLAMLGTAATKRKVAVNKNVMPHR